MKIKCIDNNNELFTAGKKYGAWGDSDGDTWSESDDYHICHGTLSLSAHGLLEMVEEEKKTPTR